MDEDCKKFLYEKADCDCDKYILGIGDNYDIEILIKAMWAINREGKWKIFMNHYGIYLYKFDDFEKYFSYTRYNNSEQESLEKVLEYIYEQEKNK